MNKQITPPSLTKRIDLNVGYSCNLKCRFCYYIKDVRTRNRDRDLSTQECKDLIRFCRRCGKEVLEFTGGEPTIRNDFFELIRYAREKVGFPYISIITNGIRLADMGYAKEAVQSGVCDFLFSIHGSSAKMHDYMTCIPGSYKLLLRAIENLLSMGVRVRCNLVVTGTNLHDIYARAALLRHLGVKIINFIMFNPLEQAGCSEGENFFRYSEAVPHLKKVIDDMGYSFDKFTIRYMPLCLMPRYENYIQNVHQVHYDHDEWDYYLRAYIREPYWKWLGGLLFGLLLLPGKKTWLHWGLLQLKHAAILQAHSWLSKYKPPVCYRCSYGFICGGVWKKYTSRFGSDELKPKQGPLLFDPWHFMTEAQRAEREIRRVE